MFKNTNPSRNFAKILLVAVFFVGCDNTPTIDGKVPFVINQIDKLGEGMCEYYGHRESGEGTNVFKGRPTIVLPERKYNIGDTISFAK